MLARWMICGCVCVGLFSFAFISSHAAIAETPRPNIVLVMADDLGYSQTGYRNHPLLRTPHLDRLAAGGLRLERFYAASAVCSPTRASVLTGRSPVRCGVPSHGHALRRQEKTIVSALQKAGYATGHFGKWHLNGLRGPGVPIFADDPFHPGVFGFDRWLSVTNFFDRDPLLSRQGEFEPFQGDSSEVVVNEALRFMSRCAAVAQPFACVIWFGTPHSPFVADRQDVQELGAGDEARRQLLESIDSASRQHYGELVAMDRSLGTLRQTLENKGLLDNTLIWFNSDNGGLPKILPSTTAPLRGHKGNLFEGGIRVPCIVHWPNVIRANSMTDFPAVTSDIAPTIADILDLPAESLLPTLDGISIADWLRNPDQDVPRGKPIGFQYNGQSAVVDGRWKFIRGGQVIGGEGLFDLQTDESETTNLVATDASVAERLRTWLDRFEASLSESVAGADYPSGMIAEDHPDPIHWTEVPKYQAISEQLRKRPEYGSWIRRAEQRRSRKTER